MSERTQNWLVGVVCLLSIVVIIAFVPRLCKRASPSSASLPALAVEQGQVVIGSANKPTGPIRDGVTVLRDVREILDAAKRDGEITVKVKLPKTASAEAFGASTADENNQASYGQTPRPSQRQTDAQPQTDDTESRSGCAGGDCEYRRGLFGRIR